MLWWYNEELIVDFWELIFEYESIINRQWQQQKDKQQDWQMQFRDQPLMTKNW